MAQPLKFYLGEESRRIVEDYTDIDSSLFTVQYNKALSAIDAYVDYVDAIKENNSEVQEEAPNNIIAFIGDRGTGKTSCMASVLNMLPRHMEGRPTKNKEKKTIASVDIVDPSFFDNNTNIIYLVVGKMFAEFRESIDNDRRKSLGREGITHDLMEAFSKVLSNITMMGRAPLNENDTDFHQLGNLLVTVDLRKNLNTLINIYLKYYEKDILIIPVDDLDNNTEQAYQMMEQIRKYLIQPNVIILISFKLEQISNVAELYFTKLYRPICSNRMVDVADMAQKYLLKLFPLEHRIALPNLKTMMEKEVEVYKSRDDKYPLLTGSSMKYTMTALIFKKTRYLFYHATGETSQIVPTNLREYRNLLSLLCNMENYITSKEEYNKQQFRDYFYGEWIETHLSEEGQSIALKLTEITEAGQFNKLVLNTVSKYQSFANNRILDFQELLSEDESETTSNYRLRRNANQENEFNRILNPGNLPYNVSIGDVFSVLNEWKKYVVSEQDKALLFFVESLYSIKLYHYYDEITEPEAKETSTNGKIDNTIKRLDELEDVSNYEKLVGGAFFNPNLLRILPQERGSKKNELRSYRIVNIKPLKDVIANYTKEDISDLEFQLVEFFALTLSRRLEGKEGNSMSLNYRLLPQAYYRIDLKNSMKAIFDLGSFFVNINNIKFAYNRINPDLYSIALERPTSILNKLRNLTNKQYELKGEYDNNRFLSWCAIRNAVILQELGKSFNYVKTRRTSTSDQIELLREFFSQVTSFCIKTYDRTDEGNALEIKFDYARVFQQLFNQIKTDSHVKSQILFKLVFDDTESFSVSEIVHGLQHEVKKSTLKQRILERTSVSKNDKAFWQVFNELVTETKITRAQAEEVLEKLTTHFEL